MSPIRAIILLLNVRKPYSYILASVLLIPFLIILAVTTLILSVLTLVQGLFLLPVFAILAATDGTAKAEYWLSRQAPAMLLIEKLFPKDPNE